MECLDVVGVPGLQRISRDFIPGYSLEQELGRGAMGMVFRARNDKTQEDSAIKILYPSTCRNSEDVARLCRESTITSRLDHPNVVRSFGSGMSEGLHYIVFELVKGESLAAVVEEKGCFAEQPAASIALEVAKGLEAAHALKIIHRDIKPENIMITRAGRVVTMDFGIAKPVAEGQGGTIAGTPQRLQAPRHPTIAMRATTMTTAPDSPATSNVRPAGAGATLARIVHQLATPDAPWHAISRAGSLDNCVR